MQFTLRNIVLIALVVLALVMFLRAAFGGGKMIGGFLDKRDKRAKRSDDGSADRPT